MNHAQHIINRLIESDEDEDFDPKELIHQCSVLTDELIDSLKKNVKLNATYEVIHHSEHAHEEHVQLAVKKHKYGPSGMLVADKLWRHDLGRVERGIRNYLTQAGFFTIGFGRDRCAADNEYWFRFDTFPKSLMPERAPGEPHIQPMEIAHRYKRNNPNAQWHSIVPGDYR